MADELKLTMDDEGYTILNKSDLADWLPKINPETKTWIVNGEDTLVLAQAPVVSIDETTGHWFINGTDSGKTAQGIPGDPGSPGRDALSFKIGTVTEVPHDHSPNVTATIDDDGNVTLDFELVAGLNGQDGSDGKTPTIKIGNVTTGDVPAITDNVSDDDVHTLDVVLPRVDMSNYATVDSLSKGLNDKQSKQDMASYYDATSVDKLLANKADLTTIANVPTKVDVQNINDKLDRLTTQVNDLVGQLNAVKQENAALKAQLATANK